MNKLKVVLKKSLIGCTEIQRANVAGLGLRRPNQERILDNTPSIRGMVRKVIHLVDVQELDA
jgi:large subunit ribosomal protein L30